ncbi:hypothetical protein DAETH_30260 [Deinococcus aetherius]|uniref:Uncharacterized protein n=1 Tax=Deinococcus aetherius TaxID=200252 RepID=A0ABM8AGY1_9DEIO|nr:hypothetical protein [Deinococcus aetherius]BDP43057.1 hypothetical protein DAETH_30260 [Deinococcus aetherius]
MTQENWSFTNAVIELRGAWRGDVHDPGRAFEGVVTESSLPEVGPGERLEVRYQTATSRAPGAAEHGVYVMNLREGRVTWPLMSFTCHDTAGPGAQGNDDTAEADWRAVPLPPEEADR